MGKREPGEYCLHIEKLQIRSNSKLETDMYAGVMSM